MEVPQVPLSQPVRRADARTPRGFFSGRPASVAADLSLACVFCLLPFLWLLVTPGWPANHELLRLFRRIGIFAGQWHLRHFIPVWSTTAFGGVGSPSPIIYNKLFNVISTLFWEISGDAKLAVVAAFYLFSVMAFLGMGVACRSLLGRRDLMIEAASGVLVVFSTYATTDWLTRGAGAEFAAFCLVPWLFAWCLTLLMEGRFSPWMGPLMALIALAHASIGLACVLPLLLCVSCALFRWRHDALMWLRPFVASLVGATVLLAPFVIAVLPYPPFASLFLLAGITPMDTHLAFSRVFWEPAWYWGSFRNLTVQIDPTLLAGGILALPMAIFLKQWRMALVFLLGTFACVVFLQSSAAFPIYLAVRWTLWIQFAFRLLVFGVVALALCWSLVLDRVRAKGGRIVAGALTCAIVVTMSLGKPWLGRAPAASYTRQQIDTALNSETNAPEPWEYYPKPYPVSLPMNEFINALAPVASPQTCIGQPMDDMRIERGKARFVAHCEATETLVLPVAFAPGMRFMVGGRQVQATLACTDSHPRLPAHGDSVVTVVFPAWWRAVEANFELQWSGCHR